ncbi:class I SAM-dependent methyltransferase [Leptospira kanakyensis]|uniref:class I SAM-dependent methyltransferase n=1 Tax=Leptospira kanakyensis TaxID=2484968 RepID=UPI00223E5204|nr:class I SAM-dependent methyltransferase [Leptospira kanakyensis]MCW7482139.1 class I SAM-dependent methyltransferase [Leptospira kanakyensis]
MDNKIVEISNQMIERYSRRYLEMGYDVKTLGWGSVEQQQFRFCQTFSGFEFKKETTLLDIGCGFGDFLSYILGKNLNLGYYTGWDINPDLINEAKKIWGNKSEICSFDVKNLSEIEVSSPVADIVIMLGLLNLNLEGKFDNYEYSKRLIKKAFSCSKDLLVVDFLSGNRTPEYPKEDFVFYHDPVKMLEFAFSLTDNVVLKHDYAPIPQKEFMLFIYK